MSSPRSIILLGTEGHVLFEGRSVLAHKPAPVRTLTLSEEISGVHDVDGPNTVRTQSLAVITEPFGAIDELELEECPPTQRSPSPSGIYPVAPRPKGEKLAKSVEAA